MCKLHFKFQWLSWHIVKMLIINTLNCMVNIQWTEMLEHINTILCKGANNYKRLWRKAKIHGLTWTNALSLQNLCCHWSPNTWTGNELTCMLDFKLQWRSWHIVKKLITNPLKFKGEHSVQRNARTYEFNIVQIYQYTNIQCCQKRQKFRA